MQFVDLYPWGPARTVRGVGNPVSLLTSCDGLGSGRGRNRKVTHTSAPIHCVCEGQIEASRFKPGVLPWCNPGPGLAGEPTPAPPQAWVWVGRVTPRARNYAAPHCVWPTNIHSSLDPQLVPPHVPISASVRTCDVKPSAIGSPLRGARPVLATGAAPPGPSPQHVRQSDPSRYREGEQMTQLSTGSGLAVMEICIYQLELSWLWPWLWP